MNPENNTPDEPSLAETPEQSSSSSTPDATPSQDAPSDALSRTPDELAEEAQAAEAAAPENAVAAAEKTDKQPSAIKRFFKKVNIYLMLFLLLVVIAAAVAIVTYLNSQKAAPVPNFGTQEMSQEDLQKLANRDVSVGGASQTMTIQGNAIIEGQSLLRGDLDVAGNFQTAGTIQGSGITVAGSANLGQTQIDGLQVAGNTAIQGSTTLRDLNVSGEASFGGAITASQITVTQLIMSGNASLQVPNHIGFTGPAPSRSINPTGLGGGGSASVNGSDTTGTVNINTGNNPAAGCFVRINFNQAFSRQPHVIISPVGEAAGRSQYYVDRNQTGFSICTAIAAPANQAFAFDYFVTN